MKSIYKQGQSLVEYSLAIGLVVLAATGTILLLSSTTQTSLIQAMGTPQNTQLASTNIIDSTARLNLLPDYQQIEIKTLSGKPFSFNIKDPNLLVDTPGANGVTIQQLALLEKWIKELKADPSSPPELIKALEKLAFKGHNVAGAQNAFHTKLLQLGFEEGQSLDTFLAAHGEEPVSYTIDGETSTVSLSSLKSKLEKLIQTDIVAVNQFGAANGQMGFHAARREAFEYLEQNMPNHQDYKRLLGFITDGIAQSGFATSKNSREVYDELTHRYSNQVCDLANSPDCQVQS